MHHCTLWRRAGVSQLEVAIVFPLPIYGSCLPEPTQSPPTPPGCPVGINGNLSPRGLNEYDQIVFGGIWGDNRLWAGVDVAAPGQNIVDTWGIPNATQFQGIESECFFVYIMLLCYNDLKRHVDFLSDTPHPYNMHQLFGAWCRLGLLKSEDLKKKLTSAVQLLALFLKS